MTTCFGPFLIHWAIIRSNVVTKEEFYKMYIVLYKYGVELTIY